MGRSGAGDEPGRKNRLRHGVRLLQQSRLRHDRLQRGHRRPALARYNGRANGNDQARLIAINPDGKSLYVTGRSYGAASRYDYATVAYNALTGAQRWASRYNGWANGNDFASGVVVAPGGKSVYVTGGSQNSTTRTANPSAHNDFA